VPPSGFGYPLDGLLPSTPGRACFIPTALLGFIPSEPSPLERWLPRFHGDRTRVPLARRDFPRTSPRTGAPSPDFQALALPTSPWSARRGLTRDRLAAPLGFRPSRVVPPATAPGFPPGAPLTRFPARHQCHATGTIGY
jgi:hypothetical protein